MPQAADLIEALKIALRRQGLTYADVGRRVGLSESSVKRLFARRNFSLERLEQICVLADLNLQDLVELACDADRGLAELTEEQERELVSDPKVLLAAVLAVNHWSAARIRANYRFTEAELVQTLLRLDRMRILDLLPGDRIRVRLARNFAWRKAGPIQRFFEQRLQQEFFDSSFLGGDELRIIVNGSLSRRSIERLQAQMRRAAEEFDALVREDRHLEPEAQAGVSMVLAIRPWEPALFAGLRRDAAETVPRAAKR